ncbi:hypothetical protein COW53_00155 [bacterium CG17_big_fil_post_rev_8_21_14_2_50_64_8]|nr:MAG: hypothetical protein COW53_00155 [bacterium CG17_big_fil_post_rev_8_21_14_2_50_64_8]PJA74220.1 MAG: hypothetical protein CO151_10445 [bacterium CG_4_9_14_3_um_filter_65_15]
MPQFLVIPPARRPAAVGDVLVLADGEARHLKTVLRTDPGVELALTDGRGFRYTGRLVTVGKGDPTVEILTVMQDETEARLPLLAVALGVVKGRRFEWALEKACELGAHRILPLRTEFGVVEPGGNKQERWQTILASALKQCGRCVMPQLAAPEGLAAVLEDAAAEVWYGASPAAERTRAAGWDPADPEAPVGSGLPGEILVCIGPEGGWSTGEMDMLRRSGARPLDLGPHVLRTETAVAASLAVLQRRRQRLQAVARGA